MFRKIVFVFCALAMLFAFVTSSSSVSATGVSSSGNSSSPGVDLASWQKTCAVLQVQLNGTAQPSITCAHQQLLTTRLQGKQATVPNTQVDPNCGVSTAMSVSYNNGNSTTCFSGTGYLGLNPNLMNVNDVNTFDPAFGVGWFRWYDSTGGYNCTLHGPTTLSFFQVVKITQVDLGASNPGTC